MDGILSLENLAIVMAFVVPGFIALSVRAQFVSGANAFDARERLLSYLSISIVYGSLVLRLVGPNLILDSTWVFLLALIGGPVLLGLILGVNVQNDIFRRLLGKLGLFTVHPVPTAWDWKFGGSLKEQWVLVTLKNGVSFAGLYGRESFAASGSEERDLYIQWIYDINEDKSWSIAGEKSVLITADEVSTVEFWDYSPEEKQHAKA